MKEKMQDAFMKTAEIFAVLSTAKRLQVGAIIVKDERIISIGYNGTPSGWDNQCESKMYIAEPEPGYFQDEKGYYRLITKSEVLHAETNAISKLAKSTESGYNASMFCTHTPCLDCAKLIYQSGITTLYYKSKYRSEDGIKFLSTSGTNIIHLG